MRKILLRTIALLTILNIYSCNYLDVDKMFNDTMAYDSIFSRQEYLMRYMWNIAASFPDEAAYFTNTPGPLATDEGFAPFDKGAYIGTGLVVGDVSEENISGKSLNQWDRMYKVIRRTNIVLGRMNEVPDLTNLDKMEVWAYTYFMRGYAYYNLLMAYGPVIIVGDNVYPTNEQPEAYANVRSTYDESIDYICEQFEKAALYLPISQPVSLFGRPTRGAAYGLIARLRLQQASPAFNGKGQTYFGSWKRTKDGVNYVSMTYDDRKWAVAAAACKRVMDMGIYQLHTVPSDKDSYVPPTKENLPFPDGVGGIDPLKSYSSMFNGETDGSKNKEYVWGRNTGSLPVRNAFPHSLDGNNGMGVSQKMVNLFYMNDGTDNWPEDAKPYNEDGRYDSKNFSTADETFSGYILKSNTFNMYRNREMRFYANIGFSGRFWRARTYSGTENKKDLVVTYDNSSILDGKNSSSTNPNDYAATGYVITKFIHDDDSFSAPSATQTDKSFGIIRYAEILLSYSEALNNLNGSYTIELPGGNGDTNTYTVSRDPTEMEKSFNQIRYRVGLPGVKVTDVDEFNKLIQRERAIEFLFENRRYYDVRRWGIYEETERESMQGMDISKDAMDGYFYSVGVDHVWIRHRVVDRKLMFLPLAKYEVRKVDGLDQNPGWGD